MSKPFPTDEPFLQGYYAPLHMECDAPNLPISGEIVAVNELLATAPEKLNEDPHGGAWLVKVKLSVPAEIKSLLSAGEYQTYLGAS